MTAAAPPVRYRAAWRGGAFVRMPDTYTGYVEQVHVERGGMIPSQTPAEQVAHLLELGAIEQVD